MNNIVSTQPFDFHAIFHFFNVFINFHEYENEIICISDHQGKVLCLGINLVPNVVF